MTIAKKVKTEQLLNKKPVNPPSKQSVKSDTTKKSPETITITKGNRKKLKP